MSAAEPTEDQQERFQQIQTLGDTTPSEFAEFDDQLPPHEDIHLIAGVDTEAGRQLTVLTDHRLITYSGRPGLLGRRRTFRDTDLDAIREMEISPQRGFDRLSITTDRGTQELMLPEGSGVAVTGEIRELQEQHDPLQELEQLSDLREKGRLTEEEYEDKKKDLLERV